MDEIINQENSIIEPNQEKIKPKKQYLTWVLLVLCVFLLIVLIYIISNQKKESVVVLDKESVSNIVPTVELTRVPTSTTSIVATPTTIIDKSKIIGTSKLYFSKVNGKIYLKHVIDANNKKIKYMPMNQNDKGINVFYYTEDTRYKPTRIDLIDKDYSWTELINEPIVDDLNKSDIYISDLLFSFKQIPNTNNFIFSVMIERDGNTKFDVYYYNSNDYNLKLKLINIYSSGEYGLPKISKISNDNKYVSFELFRCWWCGGDYPTTILLDLQTLKFKEIGLVTEFSWGENGIYGYKDYIEEECPKDQDGNPMDFNCNKDPNTLPLQTGKMN